MVNILISVILMFLAVVLIICLAIYILSSLGLSKMFKKANQDGWPAWIPIYNTYMLCKITGVNVYWLLIVVGLYFLTFIPFVGIVAFAASIYFQVLLAVSTARSFGKSDGYAVGLFFLAPIFYMILGYGNSAYLGAKSMNDFVFDHIDTNKCTSASTTTTTSAANSTISEKVVTRYCVYCGTPLSEGDKFCPNCGKEL